MATIGKGTSCIQATSKVVRRQTKLLIMRQSRFCSTEESDVLQKMRSLRKTGVPEFTPFEIKGKELRTLVKPRTTRKFYVQLKHEDRHKSMLTEQDWTKTWPTAGIFKWTSVPVSLRQGLVRNESENKGIKPGKEGNTELMKVPNFLHLTPPHVLKHCQALKKFCTPWPEGLDSKEDCRLHFPVEVVTSDYCFAGPSIRDPRSRVVTVKVKLSDLDLDEHAHQKLLKLVGNRYDKDTDMITFKTDKCPTKQQNKEYALYLLTAVYLESWNKMPWEDDLEADDYISYNWDKSKAKERTVITLMSIAEGNENSTYHNIEEEGILEKEEVKHYSKAVSNIYNNEESVENLENLKQSVLKMLELKVS